MLDLTPAAEPPPDVALDARVKSALRPLIIYESTDGQTTRKVLADDALSLQRLVRDLAAALAALSKPAEPPQDVANALHIVRNPHGWNEAEIRAARLLLADEVERQAAALVAMAKERDSWLQVWDCVQTHIPDLGTVNKPLAVAASYELQWQRREQAERERDEARALLSEAGMELARCKIFVGSREKMHPDGIALYQDLLDRIDAAIDAARGKGGAGGEHGHD